MESLLCESPALLEEVGHRVLEGFDALIGSLPTDSVLRRDLTSLKLSYESRLFAALDYHGFADMHAHDLFCRHADALLLSEAANLSEPPARRLRSFLAQASFCSSRPS